MAVRTTDGAYVARSATIISAASPFTWAGWFRIDSDRNAAGTICCLLTSGGGFIHGLRVDTDGTTLMLRIGGTTYSTSVNLVVGTWYHLAYTRATNTFRVYVDGSLVLTQTTSISLTAAGYLQGSDGGSYQAGEGASSHDSLR